MVQHSRYLHIGPGGRKCACCFPAPRSKDRRARYRSAKRKADREAHRQMELDWIDTIRDEIAMFGEDEIEDWFNEKYQDDYDLEKERECEEQYETDMMKYPYDDYHCGYDDY